MRRFSSSASCLLLILAAPLGCGGDEEAAPPKAPIAPIPPQGPPKAELPEEEEEVFQGPPSVLQWNVGTTELYIPTQDGSVRVLGVVHVEKLGEQWVESRVMFKESQTGSSQRVERGTSGVATWAPGLMPRDPGPGPQMNRMSARRFSRCAPTAQVESCPSFDYASTEAFKAGVFDDLSIRVGIPAGELSAKATYAWTDPFSVGTKEALPPGCGFGDQPACPGEFDRPGNMVAKASGVEAGWSHIARIIGPDGADTGTRQVTQVFIDVEPKRLKDGVELEVPARALSLGEFLSARNTLCSQEQAVCSVVQQTLHLGEAWPLPAVPAPVEGAASPAGGPATPAPATPAPAGAAGTAPPAGGTPPAAPAGG